MWDSGRIGCRADLAAAVSSRLESMATAAASIKTEERRCEDRSSFNAFVVVE